MVLYMGSISSDTALWVSTTGLAHSNTLHLHIKFIASDYTKNIYRYIHKYTYFVHYFQDTLLVGGLATVGVMHGNCSTTHSSSRGIHL